MLSPEKKLNFPKSVVEMMQGQLGFPEGGWPKVLQKIILDSAGAKPIKGRPGEKMPPIDFAATSKKLEDETGREVRDDGRALVHHVSAGLTSITTSTFAQYDNTSVIPTPAFFYGMQSGEEISIEIEPGKTLIIRYLTTGEPREDGTRTVFFELNGQPREVNVLGPQTGRESSQAAQGRPG